MLSHPLLPKLRRLKLSGILDTLETRAAQASRDQLSPTEFLAILDDELERREQTRLSRRVTEAGVDPTKTLASFDFAAVPDLDRGRFTDLATAAFVPTFPSSPRPLTPAGFTALSTSGNMMTSTVPTSAFTGSR